MVRPLAVAVLAASLTFTPGLLQAQDSEAWNRVQPDTTELSRAMVPLKIQPLATGPVRPLPVARAGSLQEEDVFRDAWGARKSFGLATAEVFLANVVPWAFNEFVRDASFSQVNPRSWVHNFEAGMGWDDNHFSTNQFAHPYQGSLYFNAFRSNGYNFWKSAPAAFAGSLMWECCGETHLMSVNDFITTGMGGIALGEMLYRTSSMVLDNEATGMSRFWKELAGFGVNPVRGATRAFTGRMGEVAPNPENDWDRKPPMQTTRMNMGYRGISNSLDADSVASGIFFELQYIHGSPFGLERTVPFDFFAVQVDINANDSKAMGRLQVTGSLWHRDVRETERSLHRFFVFQNYDYFNNRAYEFGGQSVSAALLSRWEVGEEGRWRLGSAFDLYGMPMAAVSSDFSFIAEVPGVRERLREYDFGVGVGGRGMFAVERNGLRVFQISYRLTYINTLNGSVANGSDANHLIHMTYVMARVPVSGGWSVGGDLTGFLRNSYYSPEEFEDTQQRSPQLRLYATWTGH